MKVRRNLVRSAFGILVILCKSAWCAEGSAGTSVLSDQRSLPQPQAAAAASANTGTPAGGVPSGSEAAQSRPRSNVQECSMPPDEPPTAPALVDLALMPLYSMQILRGGTCSNCLDTRPLRLNSFVAPGLRVSLGYRAPRRARCNRSEGTYTKDIVMAAYVDYVFAMDQRDDAAKSDLRSRVSSGVLLQVGIGGAVAVQPRVFGTVVNVHTPRGKESFSGIGTGIDLTATLKRADWHLEQLVLGAEAAYPFSEHDPSGSSSVNVRVFAAMLGFRVALGTDLANAE